MPSRLTTRDALLAALAAVVWGANFAVIRLGVEDVPPLLLAALRFTLVFAIAAPFVPRRGIPWRRLIADCPAAAMRPCAAQSLAIVDLAS